MSWSSFIALLRRRRRLLLGSAAALVVLAVLWSVLIGLWLPGWLRPRIEASASEALGTPVQLGALSVQPWTLRVTLDGLRVGPAPAPLLVLAQAQAQLSVQSFWRLAPVLRSLTLRRPQLWVERSADRRFNFSPLLDHLAARPAAPDDGEPARFALHNIRIEDGELRYSDRVLNQQHRIEQFQLGLPFLSNLPSDIETEVQPLLEARLDGSPLRVTGQVKPFAAGRPAELTLQWREVPLRDWAQALAPLLPPAARVAVSKGTLEAALTLSFEARPAPTVPRLRVQGRVALQDVDARLGAVGIAWRWQSLALDGLDLLPLERQARLASATVAGLRTQAIERVVPKIEEKVAKKAAAPAPAAVASAPAAAASSPGWHWAVGRLQVDAPSLQVRPPGGAELPLLGPAQLKVEGLDSAAAAAPARLSFSAADALGARLSIQGAVQPGVPRAALQAELSGLQLAPWLKALALSLPVPVSDGRLAATLKLQADAARLAFSEGELHLQGLKTLAAKANTNAGAAADADHLNLAGLDATGLQGEWRLASAAQPVGLTGLRLATLTLDQLDLAARRDAQGRWPLFMPAATDAAQPTGVPSAAASASASASAPASAAPPLIQLDTLRCTACKIVVTDGGVTPAARFTLAQTQLSVQGLSNDLKRPLAFELRTQPQGAGELRARGSLQPQPLALDTQLALSGVDLRAAQPYLAPLLNLTLVGAKASGEGRLKLASDAKTAALKVSYQGRASLQDLRTQDSVTGSDFLRWRNLAFDGLDVAWQGGTTDGGLTANLGRISLDELYGRFIVHPDGHFNLADVRKAAPGGAATSLTTPQAASAPAVAASAPAPSGGNALARLRWQGIAISKGRIDITDNFVRPNYSARLQGLTGEIGALSASDPEPARVKLAGSLDDGAPIVITGRVHPLGPKLFADIEGSARGIELTRLSTYAERYAGYAIDKGSLSVTVRYKLQDGQLTADNQVFLDQLTFGDKVDSPTATKLPVLLAVALLKNSRGEIDVNLPVAGSLDDPQFSIGGVVLRLIGNLLLRAVTSPFSLLAGAVQGLGGQQGELGHVPFEPGSAELSDAARARLDTLATQLADRPALKLEATGRADPVLDADGLRQRHLQRLLRNAKAASLNLTDRAARSAVTVAPEERERWLLAAYKAAEIKKPRNLIGLPKQLGPAEMEALLKGDVDASPAALFTLANRRADQVSSYLSGKLAPERVLLVRSVVSAEGLPADDKGPTTRVQFQLR
ncbi:MAG: DUF748 domain-containing protein [Burkholderiales bacterium]